MFEYISTVCLFISPDPTETSQKVCISKELIWVRRERFQETELFCVCDTRLETEYLIQLESLLRLLIMSLGAAAPRCDVNRVTEHESKNLSSESSTNRDHQMFAQNPLKIRRQDRITRPREETESSVVEVLDGRK